MKWIYTEKDLKRILCATLDVKSIKFDDKKKELVIDIEMPDVAKRLAELTGKVPPEQLYS